MPSYLGATSLGTRQLQTWSEVLDCALDSVHEESAAAIERAGNFISTTSAPRDQLKIVSPTMSSHTEYDCVVSANRLKILAVPSVKVQPDRFLLSPCISFDLESGKQEYF